MVYLGIIENFISVFLFNKKKLFYFNETEYLSFDSNL